MKQNAERPDQRCLPDFCIAALTEASAATILRNEGLDLSERDRAAFFEALVHPPKPNVRLRRAIRSAQKRVAG
jgi:uncharacterized protein (DUF1778 family)